MEADALNAQLRIEGLTVRFGGITALDAVSFQVKKGTICGVIGPNGAGKTTCFNCLSGIYRAASGSIHFCGQDITRMARHAIARLGMGRTFQNLALFPAMTVLENVLVGGHAQGRGGFLAFMLRLRVTRQSEREAMASALELVRRFGLEGVAHEEVRNLPFAVQKRVELARALAGKPALLILDEPASGLNHEEVERLAGEIKAIQQRDGITILLVEHHMNLVMRVSDQVVVLDFGRKIADGKPEDVRVHPDVVRAYLGEPA